MTEPSPAEIVAFIEKLRNQASFLGDPALTSAADFMERMALWVPSMPTAATNENAPQAQDEAKKVAWP
jgi:hypothetical protein